MRLRHAILLLGAAMLWAAGHAHGATLRSASDGFPMESFNHSK